MIGKGAVGRVRVSGGAVVYVEPGAVHKPVAMKRRQVGSILMYGLLALGILAALGGLYWAVYSAGAASVQAKWDEANRQEAAKEAERKAGEAKVIAEEKAKRLVAESRAETSELKWKEAVDEASKANRKLAGYRCPNPRVAGVTKAAPGKPSVEAAPATPERYFEDSAGVRFTWDFVSLWDSAWTDHKGEPVFGTPQGVLTRAGQPDPAALSPYGPEEVLRNQGKNAFWCSGLKRKYNSLIETLEKLEKDWTRVNALAPQ